MKTKDAGESRTDLSALINDEGDLENGIAASLYFKRKDAAERR